MSPSSYDSTTENDRVAKAAERVLYLFDKVSGQIGIQFIQDVQGCSIYVVKRQDMYFPLYYTVLDEFALLSTSLSLLKNTVRHVLGQLEETSPAFLFPVQKHRHCYQYIPRYQPRKKYFSR